MRDGHPSFTASAVALARGLEGDPIAMRLLPAPMAVLLRGLRVTAHSGSIGAAAASVLTGGIWDHVALRTREIDDAVRAAVETGIEQIVILGAGLDARAFRMPELRGATVFEVDHPATQAFKRARVGDLRAEASVHFVAVDFARDVLSDALEGAGHRAGAPTAWIWEGVTPYLERAAMHSSLAQISQRSAPGSRLLMTYATPEMTTLGVGRRLVHAGFGVIGEPLRGLMPRETAAEEITRAGFRLLSDTSPWEWAAARQRPRTWALIVTERLAVAVRD